MLLKLLLKEFILEVEIKNYSKRTLKSYRNNNLLFFNYLEEEFKITEIEDLNKNHIKSYIKYLNKRGHKPTYINSILKTIRSFLVYCIDEEYINKNPCEKVKWVKEEKKVIKTFSNEEVYKMMKVYKYNSYINTRNRCIMAMLFDTGIRCSELCNIQNDDIRPRSILIRGKGNKERIVPISPYLRKVMIRYEIVRNMYIKNRIIKSNAYFLSNGQRTLTVEAIERIVKICGEKANIRKEIRCSPHTCRHYYAQAQLRNGLDVYSLSRLLGHSNISVTKIYLQGLEDDEIIEMSVRTSPLMNLK